MLEVLPCYEVFPCFFLSCKANARVKLAKTGHGPHSSKLVVICVVLLLFVLFYVLFVCKCVLYYRMTTQSQLKEIYHKTHNPVSAYTLHILNDKHEYGNAEQATELLKTYNKGMKMNF